MKGEVRLGLNIPLFVASIVSIGTGTLVGMVAIWWYLAWGLPAPEWQKVSHAHAAWWSAIILIAAMLLPSLELRRWVKRFIVWGTFIGPVFWVGVIAAYYELGGGMIWRFRDPLIESYYSIPVLGVIAGILEFLGFLAMSIVALSAAGIRLPFLHDHGARPGRYDLLSDVYIPRKVFLIPFLIITIGVVTGFILTGFFKSIGLPIRPAALVQLHDHTALLALSALIILMLTRVLKAPDEIFEGMYRLMVIGLPLLTIGLILFVLDIFPSVAWVLPAGIYYLIPVSAALYSSGLISRISLAGYLPAIRVASAICLFGILLLVAQGAYIALVWDVSPDVTVTYRQPEGVEYPGPYPDEYLGTAPVKNSPRGLENAHLSPGSWYHIALTWLMMLGAVGDKIFRGILGRPNLIYLFIVTIPAAPTFNMLGRYLAWAGIPNGIGALFFAGHPLKGFNIISLFILGLYLIYRLSRSGGDG